MNGTSPDSVRVGEHYAKVRSIPERQVVRLKTTVGEAITRAEFETSIQTPIAEHLARHLLHDQILFIVLTKGLPLRIDGSSGQSGTIASVDSELTLLYRRMTGTQVLIAGRTDNPYYLGDRPIAEARHFSRIDSDIYLVTRLDGFTADDAIGLIERGVKASREGRIVLDQKSTVIDRGGDQWLAEAARRLETDGHGARVQIEATRAIATTTDSVLGYFSWGSNDPSNQLRATGLRFAPGAIGGLFVSTDGRTFREPGPGWKPAPAGSATGGQSLVADFVREGITGISGNVAEPFLDAIVRPQVLFPAYFAGFTLAESYYMAMPYLSWQTIVVGDPLCGPFVTAPVAQERLHRGIDASTALPSLFVERQLAALKPGGLNASAVRLQLKGLSLRAQGKADAEVEAVLGRAVEIEPRMVTAHMMLAQIAEGRADLSAAAARYRAVLGVEPANVPALNNLAYLLTDKLGRPAEALPLAERAYALSGNAPTVADTLGWTHFKLKQFAAAIPLIERAAAGLPRDVDAQIHAAAVYAAIDRPDRARKFLDAALQADPAASTRENFKAVAALVK